MRGLAGVAVAAVMAAGCASGAEAASLSVTYTYTGTVSSGVDTLGLFGSAGANLAGLSFSVDQYFIASELTLTPVGGGSAYATGKNTSSFAKVTVGSGSIINYGTYASIFYLAGDIFSSEIEQENADGTHQNAAFEDIYARDINYSGGLFSSFSTKPGTTLYRTANFFANDPSGAEELLEFNVNSFTAVASVPLPSSAPLFGAAILCLAFLGHSIRRHGLAQPA